ncbi:hypothetical protein Pryu01_01591 [Paraliobacillus ryukyuensis]|uniref:RNA-binding protein KhpB n=1 Tax=Paraliobacillus ryukyuensis TaxID=200904 RepID=A0A366EEN8_9BACI|nr:RNA-binding cell elongation regulator Jag/EloR [Paraliobacillus ryukyuensis]RBO99934.1 spoIIIJ-associated protein [Paraliobacillus ryukyuensis]
MKQLTASGQTVEDAVQSALKQLNITEDQVNVEIIDEGKKGLLGLFGSKPAVVKVTVQPNPIEQAETYLNEIMTNFTDKPILVEHTINGKNVIFDLSGENIAMVIGKRGQTLNALQYLTQLFIHRVTTERYQVTVDAEGYRSRREQTLEQLAVRLADKALKTNKHVALEPMPSFERKIIHNVLQSEANVHTYSDGVDPNRYVVIKPVKK